MKGKHMRLKMTSKVGAASSRANSTTAVATRSGKTPTVKATLPAKVAVVTKTKKARAKIVRIVSSFFRVLRGTCLNVCNIRAGDYVSQDMTTPPKSGVRAVAVIPGTYGITVSDCPNTKGTIIGLDKDRGFDLNQIKKAKLLTPAQATLLFKKEGTPHTIKLNKVDVKGHTLGSLDEMYVGFYDGVKFTTIETKTLPKGRNKKATFAVVK